MKKLLLLVAIFGGAVGFLFAGGEETNEVVAQTNAVSTNQPQSESFVQAGILSREINTNPLPRIGDHYTWIAKYRAGKTNGVILDDLGRYAIVEPGNETVSIHDKNGSVIWSTNVVQTMIGLFEDSPTPSKELIKRFREQKITSLQMVNGYLVVTVYRLVIKLDVPGREIVIWGSD